LPKLTRAADNRIAGSRGRDILPAPGDTPQEPTDSVFRNLRTSPQTIRPNDRAEPTEAAEAEAEEHSVGEADQNMTVDLGRLAWLGTVGACLIAVLILVLEGYFGYAAVTFAVAVAAAINLL
jgi:hypothetical protein